MYIQTTPSRMVVVRWLWWRDGYMLSDNMAGSKVKELISSYTIPVGGEGRERRG